VAARSTINEGSGEMGRFDGRVALVTGGARGMGASHVRGFVADGGHALVCDVLDEPGEALAAELGENARFQHLDVTNEADWRDGVRAAEEWAGGVDVLVNNAAIIIYGGVEDLTAADFRRLLDVNLFGLFLGMQAVIPSMRSRGRGSIVNIASVSGVMGFSGGIGYGAAKFGVRGLTKCAALDLAASNIRVNCVHPGTIRTPMSETASDDLFVNQPIPRRGEPEEVTAMVLFLASDDASYCTGAEFVVDGGMVTGRAESSEEH
jgi:3alpha(or 20beta)-hydroxysteroid dehydrogenase